MSIENKDRKISVSTKMYMKRTTVPVEVRKKFNLSDGDFIIWHEDVLGRIYIEKEKKFNIFTHDLKSF